MKKQGKKHREAGRSKQEDFWWAAGVAGWVAVFTMIFLVAYFIGQRLTW